jgi:hypothetical protein
MADCDSSVTGDAARIRTLAGPRESNEEPTYRMEVEAPLTSPLLKRQTRVAAKATFGQKRCLTVHRAGFVRLH